MARGEAGQGRRASTDIDLVQGHAETFSKALLRAGAGLVLVLEVVLENVMLFLGAVQGPCQ